MEATFWDRLMLLKHLYGRALEPVLEAYGLTRMELEILLFLDGNPTADTAAELISRRGLAKSHVSGAVARLVQRGYLRRTPEERDRRKVHLGLCSGAQSAVAAGKAACERFRDAMLQGFSAERVALMQQTFAAMAENAQAALSGEEI